MLNRHVVVRRRVLALASMLALISTSVAQAQTIPYSFEVDRFSVPARGLLDEFDDGAIDPNWDSLFGTAIESGTTLELSNPGVFGFLPAAVDSESTALSGFGTAMGGFGSFTASSTWEEAIPSLSQGFNFALGSINSSTGNVHQLSVGVNNTTAEVAGVLGGDPGLVVGVLSVVRDSGPGNILSLQRFTTPILASDITGQIVLSLVFDDVADTLTPIFSLDGGATTQSPFAAVSWGFGGGGFSLATSSTVPEPGAILLVGLGLAALGARRRLPARVAKGRVERQKKLRLPCDR